MTAIVEAPMLKCEIKSLIRFKIKFQSRKISYLILNPSEDFFSSNNFLKTEDRTARMKRWQGISWPVLDTKVMSVCSKVLLKAPMISSCKQLNAFNIFKLRSSLW